MSSSKKPGPSAGAAPSAELGSVLLQLADRTELALCVVQDGRYAYVNAAFARLFGYAVEELQGRALLWDLVAEEDRKRVQDSLEARLCAGEPVALAQYRFLGRRRDGSTFVAETRGLRVTLGGRPAVASAIVDVSERARDEQDLRKLSHAVEQNPDSIVITDAHGAIEYVNPAFSALTGYSLREAQGRNPRFLKSGETKAEEYHALWETIAAGRIWRGEFHNKKKSGELYWAEASICPIRGENGAVTHYVAIEHDITEHHQLQGRYLQAQKMESVGRLAGGIAHDFNNILSAILGYAQLAGHESQSEESRLSDLEEIERSAKRAAGLVRQLLAFSRRQVIRPEAVDLNRLILNLEKMLKRLIGEDIRLEVALSPGIPSVRADPGQLEQVIVNMAVNARDAMPKGGVLVLETNAAVLDAEFGRRHPEAKPGEYVMLAISDNGSGIAPETQAHLFEPYFTTKEVGRGTGLGLATCYGIVRQHGGYIWVYSEVGKGTVFKIYLPKDEAAAAQRPRPETPSSLPRGGETILLVEDEPAVRLLAARVLRRQGYKVHEAANGEDALAKLEALKDAPIDLLLTDVVMPLMGGRDLHARLSVLRPGVRTLFMSGYTDDAILHTGVLQPGMEFLEKPLLMDQLVLKVREILDKPPPAS